MKTRANDSHAVVIGASIAGLSTAQVLTRHFARVTVIERDELPEGALFRPGVPQGRHLHFLLKRGELLLEELFPGLCAELVADGAYRLKWGRELRWYHFGGWKQPHPEVTFESVFCTRLFLEAALRRRVRASAQVELVERSVVTGLLGDERKRRVVGVTLVDRDGGPSRALACDFVVDASGRESKAPEWLQALGFEAPAEKRVNAYLGYSTRLYRRPPGFDPTCRAMVVHPTPPAHTRIAGFMPAENDLWMALIAGTNRDYPPTDEAGFLAFAKSVANGEIYDALIQAEPVSPIWGYRRTDSRMRHFEKLSVHPEGFVALGDSVCAFNPVYAMGMTMGILGATLLDGMLAGRAHQERGFARAFYKVLVRELRVPWFLAVSEDSRYPGTEGGMQSLFVRALQRYFDSVVRLTVEDGELFERFLKVMHMVSPPTPLLNPAIFFRAIARR